MCQQGTHPLCVFTVLVLLGNILGDDKIIIVAALAERSKHRSAWTSINATPVAIKTAGPFGPEAFSFLTELGCRLKQVTGEAKSFSYLQLHLSVAVQRGNAAAVMGSMEIQSTTSPFDFYP